MAGLVWTWLASVAAAAGPQPAAALVVPGFPGQGEAFADVVEALEGRGQRVVVAPTDRMDPVEANAEVVVAELAALSGTELVIVSLGRGSPEVELALAEAGDTGHVAGWINIAGLLEGTPKPSRALGPKRVHSDGMGFLVVEPSLRTVRSLREKVRRAARADLEVPSHIPTVDYVVRPASTADPSVQSQRTGGDVVWADALDYDALGGITLQLLDVLWPDPSPPTGSPSSSMRH
ncbi:MAG: hypothetical protein KTR31_27810 [Myxococcales bacterium]|nr:hypothetical protein [Myxococcales bacterium]